MRRRTYLPIIAAFAVGFVPSALAEENKWIVYPAGEGPGAGKHVVLVSGDEEYRSEETLPQFGRILSRRHGFKSTVLFAIDPDDGAINPEVRDNIPGLAALADADLLIVFTRFRNLPDDQMKYIVDYIDSGRPVIGMRTATHAFDIPMNATYSKYAWNFGGDEFKQGFGRQILGETWINHHGSHGHESTRGVLSLEQLNHPILRGVQEAGIWGPTDVYGVRLPLPDGCVPLVLGQVLSGMSPDSPPVAGSKNDPMMPIAWTTNYTGANGRAARVFTTTMGASQDFASEGLRRLLVNACYWCVGLEDAIPACSNVEIVGEFEPTPFGFGKHKPGVSPSELKLN